MKAAEIRPGVFTITLANNGKSFHCDSHSDLITSHNRLRVESITNRCRRGGCGLCRIQVISGTYTTKSMSRSHISAFDLSRNIVLACCTTPSSDLVITPLPTFNKFSLVQPKTL